MRFTVLGAIVLSTLFVPGTVRAYDLPSMLIRGAPTTAATRAALRTADFSPLTNAGRP
ncbi:MAG: hypothetical protein WBL81_05770 [Pseudolabrys sp.]